MAPRRRLPARKIGRAALNVIPWAAMAAMATAWVRRPAPAPPPPAIDPGVWGPAEFDAADPGRGRCASAPWRIPALGWKDILWRTYRRVGRDRLPALAGAVTFYFLLATFPALAAFVSVYGLFLDLAAVERQLDALSTILPADVVDLIGGQMMRLSIQRQETLSAAFAVSTLVSAWSANAGMKSLFDGLNVAYGESEKRPYLRRTLLTYGATLTGVAFITVVAALTIAAPAALAAIGLPGPRLSSAPARGLVVYLMSASALTVVYRFGPSRAPAKWRWVAGGAFAAALLWMVGSIGFTWYIDTFTHFGVTYGSLGALIGFMLWVWFSIMVALIGAELNAETEHQTACDTTTGAPAPVGARGAVMSDTIGKAFTVSPKEARQLARGFLGRQIDWLSRTLGLSKRPPV